LFVNQNMILQVFISIFWENVLSYHIRKLKNSETLE
jgi:hypothetical protein